MESKNIYYEKYLKYKKKYLELKLVGGEGEDEGLKYNIKKNDDKYEIYLESGEKLGELILEKINDDILTKLEKTSTFNKEYGYVYFVLKDFYMEYSSIEENVKYLKAIFNDIEYDDDNIVNISNKIKATKTVAEITKRVEEFKETILPEGYKFAGFKLSNFRGIPTFCLMRVIDYLENKFNKVKILLNPIDASNPKSITVDNFNNESRKENLISYYHRLSKEEIKIMTRGTLEFYEYEWVTVEDLNLSDKTTPMIVITPKNYTETLDGKNIFLDTGINWGLGIEKEAVLYENIVDNIINIYSIGANIFAYDSNYFRTGKFKIDALSKDEQDKFFAYQNLVEGNNNDATSEMVEITTLNYKNNSIRESIDELNGNIKKFMELLPRTELNKGKILNLFNGEYYKDVKYLNIDKINTVDTHYLGSLHFNITLPHDDSDKTKYPEFIRRHDNFGKLLQIFEPLLCSVFGRPDNKSFLDNQRYAEGSFRPFVSDGTFFLSNKFNKINEENDNSAFSSKRQIKKTSEPQYKTLSNNLPSHNIEDDFNYKKTPSLGMDFSRRTKDSEKGRINKYFGFEFRLMDLFPMEYMEQFLKLFYLIAFFTETKLDRINEFKIGNTEVESEDKNNLDIVIKQMIESLKDGHNSQVNEDYYGILNTLLAELGLDKKPTCYEQLNDIYKKLRNYYLLNIGVYEENKIISTYKKIFKDSLVIEDNLPNYNKQIFDKIIQTKKSEIMSINTSILATDTEEEIKDKKYNKRLQSVMTKMEELGSETDSSESIKFVKELELKQINDEFEEIEKLSKELNEINSV